MLGLGVYPDSTLISVGGSYMNRLSSTIGKGSSNVSKRKSTRDWTADALKAGTDF